jgi:hypothetical protein
MRVLTALSALAGGNNLQLVVDEYQSGALAPTSFFQSAALFFSITNCQTPTIVPQGTDAGTWLSPANNETLGSNGVSNLVSYAPAQEEQFILYAVDFDVQHPSPTLDDWLTVRGLLQHLVG